MLRSAWHGLKRYVWNILIAEDRFDNACLGGSASETMSSRAGRAQRDGKRWGLIVAPIINFIMCNPNHCRDAIGT